MLDYLSYEKQAWQENVNLLRQQITSDNLPVDVIKKINNFAERHGLSADEVKRKLQIEDLACYFFAKSPAKQSIHQKLASDYIQKIVGVKNFEQLPSAGKNALYIHGGNLLFGKQLNTRKKGKSIDFEWEFLGKKGKQKCYASHKYTKEGGGAQDNQFKDLQDYANSVKDYRNGAFFFIIADGEYYQQPYQKYATRTEFMNEEYHSKRMKALAIDDLEKFMKDNF